MINTYNYLEKIYMKKIKTRLRDKNFLLEKDLECLSQPFNPLGITNQELLSLFERAWIMLKSEEVVDALRSFTFLCHLEPHLPEAWYGLGLSLEGNGLFEEAVSAFLVAETLDPTRFEFYEHSIECCLELYNTHEARHILNRLLRHKKTVEAFPSHKKALTRLDRRIEALEHKRKVSE